MSAADATDDLATRVSHDRPGRKAYRQALALFLGSLVASAIPAFLSSGVALLDPPWAIVLPITAAYVALGAVCARRAVRELPARPGVRHRLDGLLLFAVAILFAALGGATLAWETTRFLDHQLEAREPRHAIARRIAVDRGGRGTRSEFHLEGLERPGVFTLTSDDPPEVLVVRVYPGALGYRWLATP